MSDSNWVRDYFRTADQMNLSTFVPLHTDDCVVTFGNNPPAVGPEQIGQAIGGLWAAIGGMRHEPKNLWFPDDDTGIQEAVVTYTTKGGTAVSLPVTSILTRRDGKIDSLRIYIDMAPLFETIGAESAPVA